MIFALWAHVCNYDKSGKRVSQWIMGTGHCDTAVQQSVTLCRRGITNHWKWWRSINRIQNKADIGWDCCISIFFAEVFWKWSNTEMTEMSLSFFALLSVGDTKWFNSMYPVTNVIYGYICMTKTYKKTHTENNVESAFTPVKKKRGKNCLICARQEVDVTLLSTATPKSTEICHIAQTIPLSGL